MSSPRRLPRPTPVLVFGETNTVLRTGAVTHLSGTVDRGKENPPRLLLSLNAAFFTRTGDGKNTPSGCSGARLLRPGLREEDHLAGDGAGLGQAHGVRDPLQR